MKPDDRQRFAACIIGCAETYGKSVSSKALAVWWECLRGAGDIDAIEAAFWRHLRSPDVGQYFPKPADIIRMLDGTSLDASMIAWTKVERAVREVGPYASVAFDDELVHRVLADMGGWIELTRRKDVDWPFIGNEFRARYKGYKSRDEHPEYPRRLMGITEAENVGFARVESLVLIGDKAKAQQVYERGINSVSSGLHRIEQSRVLLLARRA